MNKNAFKIILLIFLLIFLGLYYTGANGYYEHEERKKVNLTNEEIIKFENDINNGNYIDLEKYLKKSEKDYNNKISNISYKTSKKVEEIFNKAMRYVFKSIDKMILE